MLQYDEGKRWSFEQLGSVFDRLEIPDVPFGLPSESSIGRMQHCDP
jgi:hypothetical protein